MLRIPPVPKRLRQQWRARWWVMLVWVALFAVFFVRPSAAAHPALDGAATAMQTPLDMPLDTPLDTVPALCRLGINVSSFPDNNFYIDDFDIEPLRAGWYVDYRATPSPAANNGAEYAMVMSVYDNEAGGFGYGPTGANLDLTIAAHPGGIYIVGNEPDRRVVQHDVLPENYAYLYHDAYHEIKAKDPNAQVWAGAIVQPTPLRLQYLDRVLAAYQARYAVPMPVDGWAIHGFLLNERSCAAYDNDLSVCWGAEIPPGIDATDGEIRTVQDNARVDLYTQGIMRFRTWMANNGYRNAPLHVTEYGVLMPPEYGFPSGIVNNYMSKTFEYMLTTQDETLGYPADDNRLVQRFAWFSTFDPGFNGYLYESVDAQNPMNPPFVLSPIGTHFRDLAAAMAESSDLALLGVEIVDSPRQIIATVGNSGNRHTPTQATLRIYQGNTWAGAEQIGEDITIALAGCGTTKRYAMPWNDGDENEPTSIRIWAQVSQFDFPDANPDNDIATQDGFVNGQPLFLPTLKRY